MRVIRSGMQSWLVPLMLAAMPVPAAATVMLAVDARTVPPCHLDLPACAAPAPDAAPAVPVPGPAVAAFFGLVFMGLAFGRKRGPLPEVVS